MQRDPELRDLSAQGQGRSPVARMIASFEDSSIGEYTCHAGPRDRPFQERHEQFTIAAVVEGSFIYHTDSGRELLHPGALLLGNYDKCFECGHDHGTGDRCIAFHFTPEFFAEISATAAGSSRYEFSTAMVAAAKHLTPMIAGVEAIARGVSPLEIEEMLARFCETVLGTLSGHSKSHASVSARDERRIAGVLRYIEDHATEPLDLAALAKVAALSKYHFLRTFQRIVGMPPYQFLLTLRMRRAALRVATSSDTVSSIAFDTGFGDLSTFNSRFRELFGMSPSAYRRRPFAT